MFGGVRAGTGLLSLCMQHAPARGKEESISTPKYSQNGGAALENGGCLGTQRPAGSVRAGGSSAGCCLPPQHRGCHQPGAPHRRGGNEIPRLLPALITLCNSRREALPTDASRPNLLLWPQRILSPSRGEAAIQAAL